MIRNLNQQTFREYGSVSPERPGSSQHPSIELRRQLILEKKNVPVLRAVSDVWIRSCTGMTVLSVSRDGENFQDYYLDKPICIRSGVFFCLSPFRQQSVQAELSAQDAPEETGAFHEVQDFQLSHQLLVTCLYTFFYHEKERGFFFPGEAHPMLELTYVDQGTLHSVVDGQETILQQGDLAVYGPDQWHVQYADIDVAPRYITISFDMEGSGLSALLNRKFKISQAGIPIMQQLLRELDRMDEYSTDMIICLLNHLLLTLLRSESTAAAPVKTSNAIHAENEIIRQAQQYISANIRQKLSVPMVAEHVRVSPSYLTALFHKNLQISPGEYIRRTKLQESKQMIREKSMNFTEIAEALQYSTVHHFSRQFKEKFGITPTEYARSVR